jgi:hypothetical protein
MRSGRLQGFIPQKLAHFEEHILMLHTARSYVQKLPLRMPLHCLRPTTIQQQLLFVKYCHMPTHQERQIA